VQERPENEGKLPRRWEVGSLGFGFEERPRNVGPAITRKRRVEETRGTRCLRIGGAESISGLEPLRGRIEAPLRLRRELCRDLPGPTRSPSLSPPTLTLSRSLALSPSRYRTSSALDAATIPPAASANRIAYRSHVESPPTRFPRCSSRPARKLIASLGASARGEPRPRPSTATPRGATDNEARL
jgi:hypothetical protein